MDFRWVQNLPNIEIKGYQDTKLRHLKEPVKEPLTPQGLNPKPQTHTVNPEPFRTKNLNTASGRPPFSPHPASSVAVMPLPAVRLVVLLVHYYRDFNNCNKPADSKKNHPRRAEGEAV